MPKTLAALDSLIARLLRTESLAALGAGIILFSEKLGETGDIAVAAVAISVFIGRSFVKWGSGIDSAR